MAGKDDTKVTFQKLDMVETAEAQRLGQEEFKFASNEEMLQALSLEQISVNSGD